jgi:hypothetical protein
MKRREMLTSMMGAVASVQAGNAPAQLRARRPVVPQQVIDEFKLEPTQGYGLWVMGENGLPYTLDDILSVIFVIIRSHWGGEENPASQRPQAKAKKPY